MKLAVFIVLAIGACGVARAEPYHGVVFTGGSVSDNESGYGGFIIALPGATLGHGFAVKAAMNGGRYDYVGGVGHIEAKYYGGQLAFVRQWSGEWGWANLSAGGRVTQTDLSPFDPGNERAGTRLDAALGADGAFNMGDRWRLGWYSEGGVRDEFYLARLEGTRSMLAGKWRLGVEGSIQGDPTYQSESVGGVTAITLKKGLELQFGGGAVFQNGKNSKPYASVGFSTLF